MVVGIWLQIEADELTPKATLNAGDTQVPGETDFTVNDYRHCNAIDASVRHET